MRSEDIKVKTGGEPQRSRKQGKGTAGGFCSAQTKNPKADDQENSADKCGNQEIESGAARRKHMKKNINGACFPAFEFHRDRNGIAGNKISHKHITHICMASYRHFIDSNELIAAGYLIVERPGRVTRTSIIEHQGVLVEYTDKRFIDPANRKIDSCHKKKQGRKLIYQDDPLQCLG